MYSAALVLVVTENKHALSKSDLKSVLRHFSNMIWKVPQIIGVFGLKKQKMFSAALVLVVMENTRAFSKSDLKKVLMAFLKYDLESAYK